MQDTITVMRKRTRSKRDLLICISQFASIQAFGLNKSDAKKRNSSREQKDNHSNGFFCVNEIDSKYTENILLFTF